MGVLITVGIIMMAAVIYLAISSKSSRIIKIVALCALGLMVLTVIVCMLIVFGVIQSGGSQPQMLPDAVLSDAPPPPPKPNILPVIMFSIVFILLFALVLVLSLRDKKKMFVDRNEW